MERFDAIIIGFGKGGKTLASDLARRGRRVAVVERSPMMYGGTCINVGCIPTKAMIHRAGIAARHPEWSFSHRAEFYRKAVENKLALVSSLRELNYRNLTQKAGATVLTGEGSFLSADTVAVRGPEGVRELTAPLIVVDTGAETVVPPIPGLAESQRVYTSASIMELTTLPRRLAVIGGGYIGLEFASMYASFGSQVIVLEGGSELMPREDRDMAQRVRSTLEGRGVTFRLAARVERVADAKEGVRISYSDPQQAGSLDADAVLVAVGRRPYTSGLGLERAGVHTNERGAIVVDERLHTSVPHIRAIGDVTGGLQFTYVSLDDYRILRDELFGDGERTTRTREPVSYSVFVDPPFSRVGMSETEARAAGLDIRVNTIEVASIPRARTMDASEGIMKAVIERSTDRILGCALFCADSHEVINTVSLAIRHALPAAALRDMVYTHPSMSETLNDLFA